MAVDQLYKKLGFKPSEFQLEVAEAIGQGKSGLVTAPTGTGKTLAVWLPLAAELFGQKSTVSRVNDSKHVIKKLLWITPLRSLSRDLEKSLEKTKPLWSDLPERDLPGKVKRELEIQVRTGDVSSAIKAKQLKSPPVVLITTPESLQVLIATSAAQKYLGEIAAVVVDEWHDLWGGKRGALLELGLAFLRAQNPKLMIWGMSATLGEPELALDGLLGLGKDRTKAKSRINFETKDSDRVIINSNLAEELVFETIYPPEVESYSWAGHLGAKLTPQVAEIVSRHNTTIVFTNTRAQAELWKQQLAQALPDLANAIAVHHGSIDKGQRETLEAGLKGGQLRAVVATSSLDLGVDYGAVDAVIQIGSPKSLAKLVQRAGRAGHRPGAVSKMYLAPTNSLELIDFAALKRAYAEGQMETAPRVEKPLDVLTQFVVSLAAGPGLESESAFKFICTASTFGDLTRKEWDFCLEFANTGGKILANYSEFHRIQLESVQTKAPQTKNPVGRKFIVKDRRTLLQHKLAIGTIVSADTVKLQFQSGKTVGQVEDSFLSTIKPGESFWFAGKILELVRITRAGAVVRKSTAKRGITAVWGGSRMELSNLLSQQISELMDDYDRNPDFTLESYPDLRVARPLVDLQQQMSTLPTSKNLLVERSKSREGEHLFCFPLLGRRINLSLAALLAHELSQSREITFSLTANDYGFELLSDQKFSFESDFFASLNNASNLREAVFAAADGSALAKRRFYEVSQIAGLVFSGFPSEARRSKSVRMSSDLLFDVFKQYDPENLIYQQTLAETTDLDLNFVKLSSALATLSKRELITNHTKKFSPFAFPIFIERLRQQLSSESIEAKIAKLTSQQYR